ncbi:MAG: alpha/beta hydrolase [Hyphomicrobiaceae bacterium]
MYRAASLAWKVPLAFAGLYLMAGVALYAGQRRLLYPADPTRVPPASLGLDVSEIELKTPDGERLVAWHAKAAPGQPTLLYFHGNGGNLAARRDRILLYRSAGYGLLMMAYRGYSGSTGHPTEANNVADAELAYHWLRDQRVSANEIVIYGESLGTGVAVQVAAVEPIKGLILDAPYTSIPDTAQRHYPWIWVKPFMADRYNSIDTIDQVRVPLLVLHGGRDRIVPVDMGQAIFDRANEPKKMVVFPEAGHLYHTEFGSFDVIREFIGTLK